MQLTEQETNVIKDLQTQEKACVDKYRFYEQSAHDEELKNLFHRIGDEEQEHFDSLGMVLKGDVPNVSAARSGMEGYTPSESYAAGNNSEEKKHETVGSSVNLYGIIIFLVFPSYSRSER